MYTKMFDYILNASILRPHAPIALLRCKIFISFMTQNQFHFVILFHAMFQPKINDKMFISLICPVKKIDGFVLSEDSLKGCKTGFVGCFCYGV